MKLGQRTLEALETRISLLRDESRYISYRIEADKDRRRQINTEIKQLKDHARELKEQIDLDLDLTE